MREKLQKSVESPFTRLYLPILKLPVTRLGQVNNRGKTM